MRGAAATWRRICGVAGRPCEAQISRGAVHPGRGKTMVRLLFLLALLAGAPLAQAAVINYEFKFTPYTGDLKDDHVQSVAGTARLFLNNVPLAEQPVGAESLPVIFD